MQFFAVEPPTSSSRRPWVPDLQPLSLRSFTLHRPLPFASPLQILLWLWFWRYHRDRLAPIYILVKASTLSETACAPTRSSKALFHWSRAPRASMRHCFRSRASTCRHALSRTSTLSLMSSTSAFSCTVADVTCLRQPLTSSFDSGGLTVDFFKVDRWLSL